MKRLILALALTLSFATFALAQVAHPDPSRPREHQELTVAHANHLKSLARLTVIWAECNGGIHSALRDWIDSVVLDGEKLKLRTRFRSADVMQDEIILARIGNPCVLTKEAYEALNKTSKAYIEAKVQYLR
jgi:hypothetical protein